MEGGLDGVVDEIGGCRARYGVEVCAGDEDYACTWGWEEDNVERNRTGDKKLEEAIL